MRQDDICHQYNYPLMTVSIEQPDSFSEACSQCGIEPTTCSECDDVLLSGQSFICSECGDDICENCSRLCCCESEGACGCTGFVCEDMIIQTTWGNYCSDCYAKQMGHSCHPFEICGVCDEWIEQPHYWCDEDDFEDS